MQTAEYDHNDFTNSKQDEADKSLLVKFYYKSVENKSESIKEGRPVFVEKEYVSIQVPGSRDLVARPAKIQDRERFPRHYQAFRNRVELPETGTPLQEWTAISRSLADQLAFTGIKTVEQLADLNDNLMHDIRGAQGLKQKAKDWLALSEDEAIVGQLRAELDQRDKVISTQTEQIKAMMERLDEVESELDKPKSKKGK